MSKPQNIVVVGGSLGGLFQGIALSRLGHKVTILERNPTPLLHDQGAGVVAASETQHFFNTYDQTKSPLAVTSHARQYLDKSGKVIHHESRPQKMTSWDLLYHILRANFDFVESEYCSPPEREKSSGETSYKYGRTVEALQDLGAGKGVLISFKKAEDGSSSSITADKLIDSSGASSTIRQLLQPDVQRTYSGYVAFRGTCSESSLSSSTSSTLLENFTFFHSPGVQILAYLIPGPAGTLQPGKRLLNWVWYSNYAENSPALTELMTDNDGNKHRFTLPPGGMRASIWEKQKQRAVETLPPQFAEAVQKTNEPFVQAITDVLSPKAAFYEGRVLLVGDALAGFRPHTAASSSQAAYDAFQVRDLVAGRIGLEEWEGNVLGYARRVQGQGVLLGERSQFGRHPLGEGDAR